MASDHTARDRAKVAAMGRRLTQFCDHRGITLAQVADRCGTSPQVLNNLSAGMNVAGKLFVRIASAYPELNLTWWLQGVGEMLNMLGESGPPPPPLQTRADTLSATPPGQTAKARER
ncbi:MAG TPA: hypothetical protein DCE41_15870, partial [Cytophagales bacterium]|nr:hypothetical protein [Cytophagales bacterium]